MSEEGKIKENCDSDHDEENPTTKGDKETEIEACTIAVFDGDTLDRCVHRTTDPNPIIPNIRIDPVPEHLPPLCSSQR